MRVVLRCVLLAACSMGVLASSQQGVELTVRHPAAAVRIAGVSHLVYELWITNRSGARVTLNGVAVLDGTRVLADYEDADLRSRVSRPGLGRTYPTPLVLESEEPAVVYFWIPLDAKVPAPWGVHHRVTMTVDGSSSAPRESVATGGDTRLSPADDAEVLEAPLNGPGWVAVYEPAMAGGHRTAIYTIDGTPRIPGRFAIDWIRLPSGSTRMDPAARPPDWNGFGAPVLAVKDAVVASASDGHPDADASGKPRVAITRDNAAGNYVSLDLGNGRFAFYEHLQQGSVVVKAGDRVASGRPIARVGSSGSVSSGPHLHFHVASANSLLGAEGVPFVLRTFLIGGAFASIEAFAKGEPAVPIAPVLARERSLERPAPNAIVHFAERRR